MRILSQNRCIDVPYDNVVLIIEDYRGKYAIIANHIYKDVDFLMGVFDSKEEAMSVMGLIRECYLSCKNGNYDYNCVSIIPEVKNEQIAKPNK